jgi:putative phosphoesterase
VKKIGLISDTHSFLHSRVEYHFKDCDEIWHAGDIGNTEISDKLKSYKPFRAVYGNIDGTEIRKEFQKNNRFTLENVDVWITHIGGYPNRYDRRIIDEIHKNPPNLFICGHSHILKAVNDKKLGLLHLNPGAAGKVGFHQILTLMRFELNSGKIENLDVIELEKRV